MDRVLHRKWCLQSEYERGENGHRGIQSGGEKRSTCPCPYADTHAYSHTQTSYAQAESAQEVQEAERQEARQVHQKSQRDRQEEAPAVAAREPPRSQGSGLIR